MPILFSKKTVGTLLKTGLLIFAVTILGITFQNCADSSSRNFPEIQGSNSGLTEGTANSSDQQTTPNGLKIDLRVSQLLSVDCSLPGAGYQFIISNAGADILMCQEYTLDLPKGNSRYGESRKCDSSDQFVVPPQEWIYNASQRQWSKTTYTNSDRFCRLYLKFHRFRKVS